MGRHDTNMGRSPQLPTFEIFSYDTELCENDGLEAVVGTTGTVGREDSAGAETVTSAAVAACAGFDDAADARPVEGARSTVNNVVVAADAGDAKSIEGAKSIENAASVVTPGCDREIKGVADFANTSDAKYIEYLEHEDIMTREEYEALVAEVEAESWLYELEESSCGQMSEDEKKRPKREPEVTTLFDHFMRFDKRKLFAELTRMLWEGELGYSNGADGFYKEKPDQPCWQVLLGYNAWRVDRDNFILDLMVEAEIGVRRDGCEGTEYIQFCVSVPYHVDDYNYIAEFEGETYEYLPDRQMIKLDSWGVPIYTLTDINAWAENIWWTHLGLDANNDISEYKAVELARIQGLKVGKLKLMGMPQTRSVLFWYDSWVDAEVKGEVRPVHVPAHTIIINLEVVKGDNCSREILHEVFHDDNHYIFFRTQQLNNNNIRQIKMVELKKQNVKPKKNNDRSLSLPSCNYLESQAE